MISWTVQGSSAFERCSLSITPGEKAMSEEIKREESDSDVKESVTVEGDVGDIYAETVTITSGAARTVEAQTVTVSQGGVGNAKADSIQVEQGGIGNAEATVIKVEQGGIGMARGEMVSVTDGGAFGVFAKTARLEQTSVIFLAAKEVSGEARILFDWRSAAVFGLVAGLTLGLFKLLTGRRFTTGHFSGRCHSEERSDEESPLLAARSRFFAPYGRSE